MVGGCIVYIVIYSYIHSIEYIVGGIFMDLSKAFNAINFDLLIAKADGYRLFDTMLMYMSSYLNNHKQRVNVKNTFSSWESIISNVPQGSISEPFLVNIFLNDPFLFVKNSYLNSYGDDNTPYCFGNSISDANNKLKSDSALTIMVSNNGFMKTI